jgi:hypothetical protein
MTRSDRLRSFATALLIAVTPTTVFAQAPPEATAGRSGVQVATEGCTTLRSARIEELLRLELATLVPIVNALPRLDVDFVCTGDQVQITLKDPVTIKLVTREVSLAASADPERTLALAASELFLASWAELLIPRPDDQARASDPGVVAAKRAVERVLPTPKPPPSVAIDLRAVGRERNFSAPIATLGAALRVGHAVCRLPQIFAEAAWEAGSVQRAPGRVDINAGAVGAGARWCTPIGISELGVFASVAALYVSIQGVADSQLYSGSHFDGFTAEASGGVDVNITFQAVRIGAAILAGVTAPGPGGAVSGEPTVRMEGPWAGAAVFAGLVL